MAEDRRAPREVRAAQLRAVALRWAIGKSVLGAVFLLGAIAHALGADRDQSAGWIGLLVILSTMHVGLGLRTFSRAWRRAGRLWLPLTLVWGLAATTVLAVLVRR
jgi:hypothetical protein